MAITQTGSILTLPISSTANTGTVSTTITVPSDAEIAVVGVAGFPGVTLAMSGGSMTFTKGGADTTMTPVAGGDTSTSAFQCAVFYLALPDTGTNKTLKWDWIGTGTSAADRFLFSITFWKGIDTASPVRGSGGGQATSLAFTSSTITAASGDLIVAFAGFNSDTDGTINSWSNVSLLGQLTSTGGAGSADGAWATGSPSGNTTVAALTGTTVNDGGIVAISLKPTSGAPDTVFPPSPPPPGLNVVFSSMARPTKVVAY